MMTAQRRQRLKSVLDGRWSDLAVVMENVHDPHNIAAVMRTCDAVGVQDIYILNTQIALPKKYGKKSSASAKKWLTLHHYTDRNFCVAVLKERYDHLYCAYLDDQATDLYAVDFTRSAALVFGNEHNGVSWELRAACTGSFIIPQRGMVRSLNISVACAVSLYEALRQRRESGIGLGLRADYRSAIWQQWTGEAFP